MRRDAPIGQMVFIGNFRRRLARELLVSLFIFAGGGNLKGVPFEHIFAPNNVDTLGVLTVRKRQLMLRSLKRAAVTG